MTSRSFDAVIVGDGNVGAATAVACVKTGIHVALVEPDILGGGATAAGMGHIVVMDDSEAQFELTRYSQLLWSRIAPELPESSEDEMPGTLWLAADDEEMAEAERKEKLYRDHNVPAHLLSAQKIVELEPNLESGLAVRLLVHEDAVLYPPAATLHLCRLACGWQPDMRDLELPPLSRQANWWLQRSQVGNHPSPLNLICHPDLTRTTVIPILQRSRNAMERRNAGHDNAI